MTTPKWDDSYRIGLPAFDGEHRALLGMVESIGNACEAGEDGSVVASLLDELLDLYLRHIAWEERWMEYLTTPAGLDHKNRHKAGHRELAARTMLMRERMAAGGDCRAALEDLGFFLTLFELIEFDFELVGLLRREGILSGSSHDLLENVLPDPGKIAASMGRAHSPMPPPGPTEAAGKEIETA